jgi:hypothetical protein
MSAAFLLCLIQYISSYNVIHGDGLDKENIGNLRDCCVAKHVIWFLSHPSVGIHPVLGVAAWGASDGFCNRPGGQRCDSGHSVEHCSVIPHAQARVTEAPTFKFAYLARP